MAVETNECLLYWWCKELVIAVNFVLNDATWFKLNASAFFRCSLEVSLWPLAHQFLVYFCLHFVFCPEQSCCTSTHTLTFSFSSNKIKVEDHIRLSIEKKKSMHWTFEQLILLHLLPLYNQTIVLMIWITKLCMNQLNIPIPSPSSLPVWVYKD